MINYSKPYKLEYDSSTPQSCRAYYDHKIRQTNYIIFMEGIILPGTDEGRIKFSQDPSTYDLIYDIETDEERVRKYDYLPVYTPAPVINTRTLKILQELCPDNFQAFPAIIESSEKAKRSFKIENEYWVINITKLIDTIDMEKSKLKLDEGGEIEDIRYLVFKEGVMQEGSILLARERLYRPHIMVSSILKEAFEKHKIKGCEFVTDEQYNRESCYS